MATYFRASWILTCLMTLVGAGCCCTQGMNTCGGSYYSSCTSCPTGGCETGCGTGGCGPGRLIGLASCRGGCGETYVDEWVSEPPCIDNCGYCDSGCDNCRQPVRSMLRLLWGTPYDGGCGCSTGCDSGCSSGCDGGCSSCGGGGSLAVSGPTHTQSCNCGGSHGTHSSVMPNAMPSTMMPNHAVPPAPGNATPTPAPVAPSSAKRLSPAQQKSTVARASTR